MELVALERAEGVASAGRVVEVVVQAQLGGQAQLGERSQVLVGSSLRA
jgi:hypothetical protein